MAGEEGLHLSCGGFDSHGLNKMKRNKKYSERFNKMFNFFFMINKKGLVTFCGTKTDIEFDINGIGSKECFMKFENGFYRNKKIVTNHPNILKSVLIGKKGWSLWVDEWTNGVVDFTFTENEIFNIFEDKGIEIPENLLIDFYKKIDKKKEIRNKKYLLEISKL